MNSTYERPKNKTRVFIETADGEGHVVSVFLYHGDTLLNLINGSNAFIEVENAEGALSIIAKSSIWRITPAAEGQQKTKREQRTRASDEWRHHSQDPYIVLGIKVNATDDQVREAYHAMARAYHPDKLIGLDLPPSMVEHGSTVFQKVNAAYKAVMEQRRKSSAA